MQQQQQLSLSAHYAVREEENFSAEGVSSIPIAEFEIEYQVGKIIGQGRCSTVRIVECKKNGKQFAGKIVNKKRISDLMHIRNEICILKNFSHPNIAKLHHVVTSSNELLLLMDIALGGELFDRIVSKGCYTEAATKSVIFSLLNVTSYLHSNWVIHRDIKPENILLKSLDSDTDIILADFGFSKLYTDGNTLMRPRSESMKELLSETFDCQSPDIERFMTRRMRADTTCGTEYYVAPEVLLGEEYGSQVDVWSIGVVMYVMLAGYTPFTNEEDDTTALYARILTGSYSFPASHWEHVSDSAKDLICHLLVVDPEARFSCADALKHAWFTTSP